MHLRPALLHGTLILNGLFREIFTPGILMLSSSPGRRIYLESHSGFFLRVAKIFVTQGAPLLSVNDTGSIWGNVLKQKAFIFLFSHY
jgi:hypothetical protein